MFYFVSNLLFCVCIFVIKYIIINNICIYEYILYDNFGA